MFSNRSYTHKSNERGFSILEVLITSAIIGIITAVVVIKYGAFNSTVLLKNQAYEIALTIREAQVYSISARGDNDAFRKNYGMYFAMGNSNQAILFIDGNESGKYEDDDIRDILVETLVIDSRFEVKELCVNSGADCTSDTLSVTFVRPDFDAHIKTGSTLPQDASIILGTTDDSTFTQTVVISSVGQISVE